MLHGVWYNRRQFDRCPNTDVDDVWLSLLDNLNRSDHVHAQITPFPRIKKMQNTNEIFFVWPAISQGSHTVDGTNATYL